MKLRALGGWGNQGNACMACNNTNNSVSAVRTTIFLLLVMVYRGSNNHNKALCAVDGITEDSCMIQMLLLLPRGV